MQKRLLLGISLAALTAASPALAQQPNSSAMYNWTGWYAGANLGYSWGNADSNYTDPRFHPGPNSFSGTEYLDGVIGGGQVGFNWQVGTSWVWGVETDFQGSAERGSRSFASDCEGSPALCTQSQSAKILWFGTLRGRAGFLYNPTTLVYATGGIAYAGINTSGTVTIPNCPCTWSYGGSTVNTGWTAGGGIEGAIPGTRSWTWKIEYLYLDLGSASGTGRDLFYGSTYSWSAKVTDNILRVGFNYGFH